MSVISLIIFLCISIFYFNFSTYLKYFIFLPSKISIIQLLYFFFYYLFIKPSHLVFWGFFLVVLGFECRANSLLGRQTTPTASTIYEKKFWFINVTTLCQFSNPNLHYNLLWSSSHRLCFQILFSGWSRLRNFRLNT
jgi:hypothetical protein